MLQTGLRRRGKNMLR
uniref:Uncharacterized protein n=1 Tax=Arundo donax TaxID=35708 RepID=A0A0A9A4G7_ARUDO